MRVDPRAGIAALGITTPFNVFVVGNSFTEWAAKNAFATFSEEAHGQTFFTRSPFGNRLVDVTVVLNPKHAREAGDVDVVESMNMTLLHEMVHVRQNEFVPVLGHPSYSTYDEYLNDPREVEAREVAAQLAAQGIKVVVP